MSVYLVGECYQFHQQVCPHVHYEGIWVSGGVATLIINFGTRWEVSGQFH